MPQGSNSQKGNDKKGRAPAHQNVYGFQHNPKSKKTAKILNSPNINVCKRCFDKIEWRKKYRKYKPRTQPGKCNICEKRNVLAAYHTICTACTMSEKAYNNMLLYTQTQQQQEIMKDDMVSTGELLSVDDDTTTSGQEVVVSNAWRQQRQRVCAMCVKEVASLLPDENESETIVDEGQNQRLKLRERISVERKLLREQEQVKQAAKDARRRERETIQVVQQNMKDVVVSPGNYNDKHVEDDVSDDEEEDPFLRAVGSESELLTGEAYQKMLLERERQQRSNDG